MVTTVNESLTKVVSYHEAAWSVPTDEISVQDVLNDIRQGRHAEQIEHLRNLISRGNRDQYNVDKKRLPGVTFSGTFSGRRQVQELKEYNALMVLDVDHLGGDNLKAANIALREDKHVLACWMSPSKEGLKGLVGLCFLEEHLRIDVAARHRAAFNQLSGYFEQTHGISLDHSGSDITRLCFLSSDPELHLRNDATPFALREIPEPSRPRRSRSPVLCKKSESTRSDAVRRHLLRRTEGKNKAIAAAQD